MNTKKQSLQLKRCRQINQELISALGNLLSLGDMHKNDEWEEDFIYAENVLKEALEAIDLKAV